MRTTLNVDDDVLQAAKEIAAREHTTAGRIISGLARRGLAMPLIKTRTIRSKKGGVPLLPSRGEIVTLDHVRKLMDREGVE